MTFVALHGVASHNFSKLTTDFCILTAARNISPPIIPVSVRILTVTCAVMFHEFVHVNPI
jgi:hypothetical protein